MGALSSLSHIMNAFLWWHEIQLLSYFLNKICLCGFIMLKAIFVCNKYTFIHLLVYLLNHVFYVRSHCSALMMCFYSRHAHIHILFLIIKIYLSVCLSGLEQIWLDNWHENMTSIWRLALFLVLICFFLISFSFMCVFTFLDSSD